jgi:hypothetical protein
MEKQEQKITNEKPISLFPLDFKEALSAFLKVKPKSKEEMDRLAKEQKEKEKPSD